MVKEQFPEMQLLDEDLMERVIEELEQGWNVLTQPLRKLQQRKEAALYPDEVPCEICGESDTSNCNVIVLCDDCDLAVHQECYGVPHIPEGPWLCRPCSEKNLTGFAGGFTAKCMLCPWPGGAMRKTTDHRWVHSLCAHLVPETAITFTASDPHDLVDTCTLQSDRAKLRCVLCRGDPKVDLGYPAQCGSKACHVAFHPMCARSAGWTVQYSTQKAYCNKHTPELAEVDVVTESDAPADIKLRLNLGTPTAITGSLSPTKSRYPTVLIGENCPLHVSRSGQKLRIPTFAPKVLIEHISSNLDRKERESLRFAMVHKIAKYWAMKRESRRGTPLLKSLQLEPGWSQTAEMSRDAFEREWADKTNLVRSLRALKTQVDLVRRRESCKLSSFESSVEIFEILSSPFTMILTKLVHHLQANVDQPGYFAHPVPCDLFPDYPLMIQYPMDLSTILKNLKADLQKEKVCAMNYPTLAHFYADLKLIWENSRTYNTRTSVFYQAADRLENYSKALLCQIQSKFDEFEIAGPFDILNSGCSDTDTETVGSGSGNFEFEIEEVEPTPARFPKAHSTPISEPQSQARSQSLAQSESVSSASAAQLKRRGRPPTRRRSEIVTGGSIDSIASSEDGQLVTSTGASSGGKWKKPAAKMGKVLKKRGRPPKIDKQETAAGDRESTPAPAVDQINAAGDLFWVPTRNGNWCPGELFTPAPRPMEQPPKRAKRAVPAADSATLRLFNASRSVLRASRAELKALTDNFEGDLEGLQWEGVVSRKHLAAAHLAALQTLPKHHP